MESVVVSRLKKADCGAPIRQAAPCSSLRTSLRRASSDVQVPADVVDLDLGRKDLRECGESTEPMPEEAYTRLVFLNS